MLLFNLTSLFQYFNNMEKNAKKLFVKTKNLND